MGLKLVITCLPLDLNRKMILADFHSRGDVALEMGFQNLQISILKSVVNNGEDKSWGFHQGQGSSYSRASGVY